MKQFPAILLMLQFIFAAQAGTITTDGSMGATSTLTGPNYTIPQSLGTTAGSNLFHSFSSFDLSQGDIATFTGATNIHNVISRVTSGVASNIDGSIQSQIGTANFFFLNPAGVVFGSHAQVNVPGDFHVSTANELRFTDGTKYSSSTPNGSLTSVPPEAFGFLGKTGTITLDGSQLNFTTGSNVSFSGGAVVSNNATVSAPSSNLRIYSQGNTLGTAPISGALPTGSGVLTIDGGGWDVSGDGGGKIEISGGAITLSTGAGIYNHNQGATKATGSIHLAANTLIIDGSYIKSRALKSGTAGAIAIDVTDAMRVANGGIVSTSVYATDTTGNAGNITLNVGGTLQILGYGQILSLTQGLGNAGNIAVNTGSLDIDGQAKSEAPTGINTVTISTGNAGDITVKAGTITITNGVLPTIPYGVGIYSDTLYSSGNGGTVTVQSAGELRISSGGEISSSSLDSSGKAGAITITAKTLVLDGQGVGGAIGSLSRYDSTGNTGDVTVNITGALQITNGGAIGTLSSDQGKAGNVAITANSLTIDGKSAASGAAIFSSGSGAGDAGDVVITVKGQLEMQSGGMILSDSLNNAGNVTINAGTLNMTGSDDKQEALINSQAQLGNGGEVIITVQGEITIQNFAFIESSVAGAGRPGRTVITAKSLTIDGGAAGFSYIGANAVPGSDSKGRAGDVEINVADHILLRNGGHVLNWTQNNQNAGDINITTNSLTLDNGGIGVDAGVGSTGNAGLISVQVHNLTLLNGGSISSSTYGTGKGGTITVTANNLTINNSDISSQSIPPSRDSIISGDAGNITLVISGEMSVLNGQVSSETGTEGQAGTINIVAGNLTIDGKNAQISSAAVLSTGKAGTISLTINKDLRLINGGYISNASQNAATTGAGPIKIAVGKLMLLSNGTITTSAETGNGGAITIDAHAVAMLNSQVTTSVRGAKGNGGDITIRGGYLVMDTGFIQANTAAQKAKGGAIFIGTEGVVGSKGVVEIGGTVRRTYHPNSGQNVIQAAAPGGESGMVTLSSMDRYAATKLIGAAAVLPAPKKLSRISCAELRKRGSLHRKGRGGLPDSMFKHKLNARRQLVSNESASAGDANTCVAASR